VKYVIAEHLLSFAVTQNNAGLKQPNLAGLGQNWQTQRWVFTQLVELNI